MSGARQATYRADAEDIEDQMRDMRELYSCMHCKHTWIPRKEIVRICPKCKRMLS
jgi:Zn finger protein HypA/HybF involved in hydrogenase expression